MIFYEPFDGKIIVNNQVIIPDSYTAVIIATSDLHYIEVNGESRSKYIKLSFSLTELRNSYYFKFDDRNTFLFGVFNELKNSGEDIYYKQLLVNIAIHIIEQNGKKINPLKDVTRNNLIIEAIKIINENFKKTISLETTAKELFVSPPYLSKVFKNTIGIGFSAFLSEIRLDYASNLLCYTSKSVSEVCFESGFNNFSHFIRKFKQKYNLSPSDYRTNIRKNEK